MKEEKEVWYECFKAALIGVSNEYKTERAVKIAAELADAAVERCREKGLIL